FLPADATAVDRPLLAHRLCGGGRGDRRSPALPLARPHGQADPGGGRRPGGGRHRRGGRPARVRGRGGDRLRDGRSGRDRLRRLLVLRPGRGAAAADLRLRGGGDRRRRVSLGNPPGRDHPGGLPGPRRPGRLRLRRPRRAPGVPGRARAAPDRPDPGSRHVSVRVTRSRRPATWSALAAAVVFLVLLSLPYVVFANVTSLLVSFFILLVLATMWNLLAGYAGLVSVGQQAYLGLGAYTVLVLAQNGVS